MKLTKARRRALYLCPLRFSTKAKIPQTRSREEKVLRASWRNMIGLMNIEKCSCKSGRMTPEFGLELGHV
jgi:hypothetical protein